MAEIQAFSIVAKNNELLISFDNNSSYALSFEYLRVYSPLASQGKNAALVTHKKLVKLIKIESVGKHGYRFIFDDNHQAIYSTDYLNMLHKEFEQRWQHYLNEIEKSPHSREASIDITQL